MPSDGMAEDSYCSRRGGAADDVTTARDALEEASSSFCHSAKRNRLGRKGGSALSGRVLDSENVRHCRAPSQPRKKRRCSPAGGVGSGMWRPVVHISLSSVFLAGSFCLRRPMVAWLVRRYQIDLDIRGALSSRQVSVSVTLPNSIHLTFDFLPQHWHAYMRPHSARVLHKFHRPRLGRPEIPPPPGAPARQGPDKFARECVSSRTSAATPAQGRSRLLARTC
jgi:hypothetical protein